MRNYMTSFAFSYRLIEFSKQPRNLSILSSSKARRSHSHFSPRIVKHFPPSIHGLAEIPRCNIHWILDTKVSFPWVICELGLCIFYFSEFFLAKTLLFLGADWASAEPMCFSVLQFKCCQKFPNVCHEKFSST